MNEIKISPENLSNRQLANLLFSLVKQLHETNASISPPPGISNLHDLLLLAAQRLNIPSDVKDEDIPNPQESLPTKTQEDIIENLIAHHVVSARSDIFQLVQCSMRKVGDSLQNLADPLIGSRANFDRELKGVLLRKLGSSSFEQLLQRTDELEKLFYSQYKKDNTVGRIGSLIVVSQFSETGYPMLTFLGGFSSEIAGNSKRGRTNFDNSLCFEFQDEAIVTQLVENIDVSSRGYEPGTKDNYLLLMKVIKTIFPFTIHDLLEKHIYERQEITSIHDLRNSR